MFFWGTSPSSALVRGTLLRALGGGGSARWPIAGVRPLSAEVRDSHLDHICTRTRTCDASEQRRGAGAWTFIPRRLREKKGGAVRPARKLTVRRAPFTSDSLSLLSPSRPLPAEVSALGLRLGTPGCPRSRGPSVQTRLGEALPA